MNTAPPSYQPLNPQQMGMAQGFQNIPGQNPQISYQQWLAMRGAGNPYAPVPQQQPAEDFSALFKSFGIGKGAAATAGATSTPTVATGLASDAGANAAYNAAAQEASGAPMTLMDSGTVAPGAFDFAGFGGAGNAYLPAVGALGALDLLRHDRGPGRGALQGAASGAALGSFFPGAGTLVGAGVGGALGLAKGLLQHKTTRDVANEHTSDLQGQFTNNPGYQAYVQAQRQGFSHGPSDPSKPFGNSKGDRYATFNEYKKAGLDADNLSGVYGNIKTYGQDWSSLSAAQRRAVTQANIDSGLYNSKKGEVVITDSGRARQNYDSVLNGSYKIPVVRNNGNSGGGGGSIAPGVQANQGNGQMMNGQVKIPVAKTSAPTKQKGLSAYLGSIRT